MPLWRRTLESLQPVVLPATVGCYVIGFVTHTVYLGALGATSFELLRARYIATGLLCIAFVGSVVLPIRILGKEIVRAKRRSLHIALRFVFTTLFTYFGIAIVLSAVHRLFATPNVRFGTPYRLSEDFVSRIWHGHMRAAAAAAVGIACVFLFLFFVRYLFRVIQARRKRRKLVPPPTLASVAVPYILLACIFIAVLGIQVAVVPPSVQPRFGVTDTTGLNVFLLASLLCYLVATGVLLFYLFHYLWDPEYELQSIVPGEASDFLGHSALGSMLVGGLISIFIAVVFPAMPKHLGGGLPERARIQLKSGVTVPWSPDEETFLLDRTPSNIIVMLMKGRDGRVVQLASDRVDALTFE